MTEALGIQVDWDGTNKHVLITTDNDINDNYIKDNDEHEVTETMNGTASWYGSDFHGSNTASGETYDKNALTAAHPTLPFGTNVRVTFKRTNESVIVRINDRGPFSPDRIIDLSKKAADTIGLKPHGLGEVTIEVLDK
ncbi:septal ring lytic transglycosylase RlpA family lipoprotein [Natranaerobius trueperi]|uniref:Probable endolytic peptidoglycan transglycosylase RlpA n=2 Tax=Natranaerobius trueperi TaxID=759412 RepID=A0A226BX82_9FIRM|nr:septal ring lytic transglycosylase RlpA family lipoprotein [Natranaerobius trueperi]